MSGHLRLVEVAHLSSTGHVRSHNEDRSFARPPLLAVADGMGGAKAGEVAAQIAIDTIAADASSPDALRDGLLRANRRIRALSEDDPARAGMGTTVTAAVLDDGGATLMHVGDSRAYLLRGGTLRRLTDDHSVVAEMVRQGQLSSDDAERHPSRHIITRALGAEADVEIDEATVDIEAGDVLLLCTDGLSSLVRDSEIEELMRRGGPLGDLADTLVGAALDRGGTDNVTVVLGLVGDDPGGSTARMPVVEAEPTAPIRLPPPPEASPKPSRTPVVLEPTAKVRSAKARIIGLVVIVILLLGAFGAWAGSRTYFVDGDADGTVRVYHGVPVSIAGVDLFAQWADTGVAAAPALAAGIGLGRSARGQGDAVQRAVAVIWRFGLPAVPEITVPPAKPATRPRPAAKAGAAQTAR